MSSSQNGYDSQFTFITFKLKIAALHFAYSFSGFNGFVNSKPTHVPLPPLPPPAPLGMWRAFNMPHPWDSVKIILYSNTAMSSWVQLNPY